MTNILEESIKLYQTGLSVTKIRKTTGVSIASLYRGLKRSGINRTRKPGCRKYHVTHDYFSIIDTDPKAYWLGFIYADGCITKTKAGQKCINVTLKDTDESHLEKFKMAVGATYPIGHYRIKGFNGVECPCARLLMTSERMFDDLLAKGVFLRKSLILQFPTEDIVPTPLIPAFVRGYFDGDGSFAKHGKVFKFKMIGTKNFLLELASAISHPNPTLWQRKSYKKNNYSFQITGRQQVCLIGDWMYKDATVFLERKYQRYDYMKNISGKDWI